MGPGVGSSFLSCLVLLALHVLLAQTVFLITIQTNT